VLSAEALALALAGLIAGATGSWSPCGFSMIETLGRRGRATGPSCAAFALGAPVGGVVTFGGLALLGAALHGGRAALGVAVAIAVAGAALDGGGVRVAPQIRRQVPEPWRRVLPLPVAAALYGVLLGLGFTTYVLSFAVPALAAVAVALGDPFLGLLLGVAFGLGRALPIVVLAPLAGRESGLRAMTAMAERPRLLRAARAGGAAALLLCAAAFAGTAAQGAVRQVVAAGFATDPTVGSDGTLAWQVPGGAARFSRGGALQDLPGKHPAFGGTWLALVTGDTITLTSGADGSTRTVAAPGADAVAVSDRWLVWRAPAPDRLFVVSLTEPGAPVRVLARAPAPASLSRPAVDGDLLAYGVADNGGSSIRALDLAGGAPATLRATGRGGLLTQPALSAGRLLYVRATHAHQQLLVGPARPGARDREVLRVRSTAARDAGHERGHTTQGRLGEDRRARPLPPARYALWTTALAPAVAYVTRLRRDGRTADIVRMPVPPLAP
jgi:hypothetical protein